MPMVENHVWRVIYTDGTQVPEYESPEVHHSFDEVEIDRVGVLILEPNEFLQAAGPAFVCEMAGPHAMRPIMFRTVRILLDHETGQQTNERWHVFGYQETVDGTNVKTLMYLSNDDPTLPVLLAREPLF